MLAWIPAAIAGGASLIGTWMGSRQSGRNISRTNAANMQLARYGYDKDLEMWHRQNEYNAPEAQMQRFEDAGLNKHMIYGQGTPGNATGMPTFSTPTVDYRGTPSVAGETLKQFTGAGKGMLELQRAKEDVAQSKIDSRIQKATENARTEREVNEALEQWYRTNLMNMEYDYKNFGVDNAETGYKVVLRHMLNNSDLTEDQMRKILTGISIGKEVKDILKAFGFGSLIGNIGRKNKSIPKWRPK